MSAATTRSLRRLMPRELSDLRSEVAAVARSAAKDGRLLTEAHFLLRAQQHLHELNVRYFPQSGMTQQEIVAATAARVGLRMPKSGEES